MRNRCRVNLVAIAKLYTIGGIPSQLSNVGVFLTRPFGIRWIWKRSSTCLCQLMDFREVRETRSRVLFPRAIYKSSEDSGCFFRPGDPEDGRREHEMRFLIRRTVEHGAWDRPEPPHTVLRMRLAVVHHCRRAGSVTGPCAEEDGCGRPLESRTTRRKGCSH